MVTLALSLFVLDCKCNKVRKNAEVRAVIAFFHTESPGDHIGGPLSLSLSLSLSESICSTCYMINSFIFQMPYNVTSHLCVPRPFVFDKRIKYLPVSLFKCSLHC